MGQRWNWAAVRLLGRVLRQPSLLVPHVQARGTAAEVQWQRLAAAGCRALVVDKDNTVAVPYGKQLAPGMRKHLEEAQRVFEGALLFSNTVGFLPYEERHSLPPSCRDAFLLPVLVHRSQKPGGGSAPVLEALQAQALQRNAQAAPLQAHEIAIVGDRLATDVLFGNLHGMRTVHCLPLTGKGETVATAASRILENAALALLRILSVRAPPLPRGR